MSEVSNMCIDLIAATSRDGENEVYDSFEGGTSEHNLNVKAEHVVGLETRLRSKLEELRVENSLYKTKLFHLEEIVVPRNSEESQQLLTRIAEKERELSITTGLYSDIQSELKVARETWQSLNNTNTQLQNQLTALQAQNEQLKPADSSLNERFKELQTLFERQSQHMEELLKVSSETDAELDNVKAECSKITKEKFEIREKLLESENSVKSLKDENRAKDVELGGKDEELNYLKSEFRKLLLCNNDVLKRLTGETETVDVEDDHDENNASTDAIDATSPESHANINKLEASSCSGNARSASAILAWKKRRLFNQNAKPFPCKFGKCSKSYSHPGSLRQHQRNAHNVVLRKRRKKKPRTLGSKNLGLVYNKFKDDLENVSYHPGTLM